VDASRGGSPAGGVEGSEAALSVATAAGATVGSADEVATGSTSGGSGERAPKGVCSSVWFMVVTAGPPCRIDPCALRTKGAGGSASDRAYRETDVAAAQ